MAESVPVIRTRGEESDEPGPQVPDEWFDAKPVSPYGSVMASCEAAFTFGERFTVLPSLYFGWNSTSYSEMHCRHGVVVGGFMPNRYTERQIPFFGFSTGFRSTSQLTVVPQLDLRYRFLRKNFITARAGMFKRDDTFRGLAYVDSLYAFGAEYSRQSIVGPLRVAVQWCTVIGFSAYASVGFDF